MTNNIKKKDPDRVAFLRSLPLEIKGTISGEEADQFMCGGEISESLYEKIKEYIAPADD